MMTSVSCLMLTKANTSASMTPASLSEFNLLEQKLLSFRFGLVIVLISLYIRICLNVYAISPLLSGVRPATGGRAAPGADGARDHLPTHMFLAPNGRCHP